MYSVFRDIFQANVQVDLLTNDTVVTSCTIASDGAERSQSGVSLPLNFVTESQSSKYQYTVHKCIYSSFVLFCSVRCTLLCSVLRCSVRCGAVRYYTYFEKPIFETLIDDTEPVCVRCDQLKFRI